MKKIFFCILICCCSLFVKGADRLAIAEPTGENINSSDLNVLWSILESTVNIDKYEVISRASLSQILTEIGLSNSSNLVDMTDAQRAELGKIKGVNYILVSKLNKISNKVILSLMIVNTSTGEILPEMKVNATFENMDEMINQLEDVLRRIHLVKDIYNYGYIALLYPIITEKNIPGSIVSDFNISLQGILLKNNYKVYNYQNIKSMLDKHKIVDLNNAEPAVYSELGKTLKADSLIQSTINRFEITEEVKTIKVTNRVIVKRIGRMEGDIKIIKVTTGEITHRFPFKKRIDFSDLPLDLDTTDWNGEDYQKYLLEKTFEEIIKEML